MKNTFKFMLVAVAMTVALASCGGGKTESTETADSTAVETPAPADTTAAAPADSTAAK
jgi:hypothetical protein